MTAKHDMPDLLLELFSEEIPARMQRRAADDLKKLVTDALVERGFLYEGAQAFATPVKDQPPPDVGVIAADLSRARSEAVRQAMVANGIPAGRIVIDGAGADEPVADNSTPRGRLANRRVEVKLFVPR